MSIFYCELYTIDSIVLTVTTRVVLNNNYLWVEWMVFIKFDTSEDKNKTD